MITRIFSIFLLFCLMFSCDTGSIKSEEFALQEDALTTEGLQHNQGLNGILESYQAMNLPAKVEFGELRELFDQAVQPFVRSLNNGSVENGLSVFYQYEDAIINRRYDELRTLVVAKTGSEVVFEDLMRIANALKKPKITPNELILDLKSIENDLRNKGRFNEVVAVSHGIAVASTVYWRDNFIDWVLLFNSDIRSRQSQKWWSDCEYEWFGETIHTMGEADFWGGVTGAVFGGPVAAVEAALGSSGSTGLYLAWWGSGC